MTKDEQFAEYVKPLQQEHHVAVLKAEGDFAKRLDEFKYPKYPDTNYWDKYGPMINGYARAQFYAQQERRLEEELSQIDSEFLLRMELMESEFFK